MKKCCSPISVPIAINTLVPILLLCSGCAFSLLSDGEVYIH